MKRISILLIPFHSYKAKEEYMNHWDNRVIGNNYNDNHLPLSENIRKDIITYKLKFYPPSYRFNDIIGYAELVIENDRDILVYYHLNGDRRKRYNQGIGLQARYGYPSRYM